MYSFLCRCLNSSTSVLFLFSFIFLSFQNAHSTCGLLVAAHFVSLSNIMEIFTHTHTHEYTSTLLCSPYIMHSGPNPSSVGSEAFIIWGSHFKTEYKIANTELLVPLPGP